MFTTVTSTLCSRKPVYISWDTATWWWTTPSTTGITHQTTSSHFSISTTLMIHRDISITSWCLGIDHQPLGALGTYVVIHSYPQDTTTGVLVSKGKIEPPVLGLQIKAETGCSFRCWVTDFSYIKVIGSVSLWIFSILWCCRVDVHSVSPGTVTETKTVRDIDIYWDVIGDWQNIADVLCAQPVVFSCVSAPSLNRGTANSGQSSYPLEESN